jgi:peptide/nickel transport system substrate-binding protein
MLEERTNYWKRLSRRRFIAGSGVAAIGAGALLAGCGDDDDGDGGGGGSGSPSGGGAARQNVPTLPQISLAPDLKTIYSGTPKKGGSLNIGLGGGIPDQYAPPRDAGYPGLQVAGACLSNLVRAHYPILGELKVEPDLAESWEQPDNQTLTLKLRKGAKWQPVAPVNGRAITSTDIKENVEYWRTPQPDFVLAPMFAEVDKIETPDDTTVRLHTRIPYAPLLNNLADVWAKLIPREQYQGDLAKAKPVGSGPFQFDRFTNGVEYVVVRNPNYYIEGKPYLDEVHFRVFDPTNPNLAPAAFRAKQMDTGGAATIPLALDLIKDTPNANWGWRYFVLNPLMLNNSVPPFNDERVRQAVMHSVDHDAIIKINYQNFGEQGQQIPLWYTEYRLPDSDLPKRDIAKAKQLLSAAGQSNLKVTDKTFQGGQLAFGTTQVQQALQEAGITMDIEQMQWADWRINVYGIKGDFQLTMGGEFDYLSLDRQLYNSYHSKGANNNRHVKDTQLDKMLDDARGVFDHQKSVDAYKAISKYITDHAINIALANGTTPIATQPRVKGWFYDWSAGALLEMNFMSDIWLENKS